MANFVHEQLHIGLHFWDITPASGNFQEVGVLAEGAHYDLLVAKRVHAGHNLACLEELQVHIPGGAHL